MALNIVYNKKQKDSLKSRGTLAEFLFGLEILGVARVSFHQLSSKQKTQIEVVIHANMLGNNDIMSANSFDIVDKIPTDEKHYYKCPMRVRNCI